LMLPATNLGDMTKSEANKLRSIIGKKRDVTEFEQYKQRFMDGATKHISEQDAEKLWHDFEAHAGYSFNRSHAVAYTMITYRMMWLKLNYPLEFMTAVFRHENDRNKRVEVFIEMRRLGLRVKLPHVNKSGERAEIVDDYIRLGLADVKYISDMVFHKIDQARPFNSYEELRAKAEEKGSGINSRAVAALRAVGAVPFSDAPHVDTTENLYEYLALPKFKGRELPVSVLESLTSLDMYNDGDVGAVKAMVTNVKRGKNEITGREWVQVEMVDETGKATLFGDPDNTPEAGNMYVFLIAGSGIIKSVGIDDFGPGNDAFSDFMYNESEKVALGEVQIIAVERRFTKKRQMMATLVVANSRRELRRVLVFPRQFGKYAGKFQEGKVVRVKLNKLDDGALSLEELK
jgi:DNA polymerase III subunit alpha